jgi:putative ABC transport system substrate-binding protein
MKRRQAAFGAALGAWVAALPFRTHAQQTSRPKLVAQLGQSSPQRGVALLATVKQSLRDLGWIEGKNISYEYRAADGHTERLAALARDGVEGAVVAVDGVFYVHSQRLGELLLQHRLPAISQGRELLGFGGLMSYAAHAEESRQRMVSYIDRILRGAKPAELPIERPTRFELVVNLKVAKALGITIPPSLLLRADEVIQ